MLKRPKVGVRTSGTSWVKRTTQGHGKCLGRSRVERASRPFVEMNKEGLGKSPFIDRHPSARAEVPIVKAIIMQFTILSHKASVVKGFCKIFCRFFLFDKNRQISHHASSAISPRRHHPLQGNRQIFRARAAARYFSSDGTKFRAHSCPKAKKFCNV